MTQWRIREATSEDLPAVLGLWLADDVTPSVTDSPAYLERLLERSPGALLVAVDDSGQIVCSIIATFDGWRAHLARLAVATGRRRQGMARMLVREAEIRLRAQGAYRVDALVESDHPLAVSFWNASVYTLRENVVRYYRDLD